MGVAALVMIAGWLSPTGVAAQAPAVESTQQAPATWVVPTTPNGQPDLQGYWTSLSFTPFERPEEFGTREFLNDEELRELFEAGIDHSYEFTFANSSETPVYDATVWGLDAWQNGVRPNRRTSQVVDPADGRLPSMTPEAQARPMGGGNRLGPFDGPKDLTDGRPVPHLWRAADSDGKQLQSERVHLTGAGSRGPRVRVGERDACRGTG